VKQRKTLKGILSAIAAGVSDRLWSMEEIVALIDNAEAQAINDKRAAPYSN
jgi:hypothetical protein